MVHIFVKLFHEGGWVLYPIFLVSIVVWYIGIGRIFRIRHYMKAWKRLRSALAKNAPAASLKGLHPAFVTLARKIQSSTQISKRQRACSEFMSVIIPKVDGGVSTIAACVVIAPLLGLLGTITRAK